MKPTKTELMIYYLLSCCAIHGLSNGQENAENNAYSTPIEDTAQFHKKNQERRRVKCDFFKRAIKLSYLNLWYAMDTTSS